jgi:hypothetical protein
MLKQVSREDANKILAKPPSPHESRFILKDIAKELKYKFQTSGQTTLEYNKMMVYEERSSKPKILTRKDIERGKCNEGMLEYDPNYAYVNTSTSTCVPDFSKNRGRDIDFMARKNSIEPPSYDFSDKYLCKKTKSGVLMKKMMPRDSSKNPVHKKLKNLQNFVKSSFK